MRSGILSHSSVLQMDISSTYTPIANVMSISGPGLSRDAVDVTSLASTGGWREYIAGLADGGELSLEIAYDPDANTHDGGTGLASVLESGTVTGFRILFSDATPTQWDFNAIVTGFEPSLDPADALKAAVTLKVTGQPTIL